MDEIRECLTVPDAVQDAAGAPTLPVHDPGDEQAPATPRNLARAAAAVDLACAWVLTVEVRPRNVVPRAVQMVGARGSDGPVVHVQSATAPGV